MIYALKSYFSLYMVVICMFKKKSEEKHISYEAFAEGFREDWLGIPSEDARFYNFVWDAIQADVKASYEDYLGTPKGQIRSHYTSLVGMIYEEKYEGLVEAYNEIYVDESW